MICGKIQSQSPETAETRMKNQESQRAWGPGGFPNQKGSELLAGLEAGATGGSASQEAAWLTSWAGAFQPETQGRAILGN